jgi:hypothetical protein
MRAFTVKTRYLGCAALLAAMVLAGCGGGSSLSNTQLESQVSRICTQASARIDRIATPASPEGSVTFLERGASALTPELTLLRAVHPPNDVADVYSATVGSFAQKISELRGTARDIEHGADPVKALQHLQQRLGPLESQENNGWQALELPDCISR